MKKIIITIASLILLNQLTACANTSSKPSMKVGQITSETLLSTYQSFSSPYMAFDLSADELQIVKTWNDDLRIDVFFGTWCHDSQREVPKFIKLLENNNRVETTLVALDYKKSDPKGLSKTKGVKFTPTFIIHKNNKEVGRIIERPKKSLVADIEHLYRLAI